MLHDDDIRVYWNSARTGDKQALFALHSNTYFHLVRFGLKICGDDELVKDCINQLFLMLWDKRQSLPDVQQVRSYLFTCLRRQLLDELAYRSKMDAAHEQFSEEIPRKELSYEEIIINVQQDEELKQKLHLALEQLSPRQKELIRLKFFEGMSYEQIAEQTTQTIKTAYNTVYDAIKQLRKILK
ncbi:RNA polymerase sigma-70 factor (ECF subfamily) [Chitinophaga skermanii]|uniref:RNA polymerase sigma-70 factor (ECF subfamily) n=1 Tax=Chitinophaga skermanii TaxID=331697 RepID=A0A327QSM2_9BACT|nr:sigma-70 family RNA polymerase sigma factor [Chitinophaga skermanii]RAJ06634.1 RNA polymerase sigma-70 factor (ECF subfamily) [Chitinophaga skermanii]